MFLRRTGMADPSIVDVVNAIKQIPHGRPSERTARAVVEDWRGTCSTKLLLLREMFPEARMRFFNRVFYLMPNEAERLLGQRAAAAIPAGGMVDVHTFAKLLVGSRWLTIDLTFPGERWDGSSDMGIPWGEGDDFEAGDDPIAHKEALVKRFGNQAIRRRLIEAIS
jgi:hypothetical protein